MDNVDRGRYLVEVMGTRGFQAVKEIIEELKLAALEKLEASEQGADINRGIRKGLTELESQIDDCVKAWEKADKTDKPETTL